VVVADIVIPHTVRQELSAVFVASVIVWFTTVPVPVVTVGTIIPFPLVFFTNVVNANPSSLTTKSNSYSFVLLCVVD
jgi:trehalose-6-phosphate synthase